ncbi:MAG: NAD-dependent epimerase/dehydratase family protein, partial [Bdellovibrio sp.]|nr:NAD-dependent epimerase/dehydratase family protein [Bdellovibrio sp.]
MGKKNLLLLGGSGLIGSALRKLLNQSTEWNVIAPTRQDLDLREAQAVAKFFDTLRSEVVINAAGKSGGVLANKNYPADFILENNQIQMNILHSALRSKVAKLIQFIPACIYPTTATLPYREASILTGPLEESSQYFAIAKINALMMAQAFNRQHGTQFISLIPSNVYGPMTKTASENSHVVPSLLHKMKSAKATNTPHVEVWGNGSNLRDYLHTLD